MDRRVDTSKDEYGSQGINQILDSLYVKDWTVVNDDQYKFNYLYECCSLNLPPDSILIGKCSQVLMKIIQTVEPTEEISLLVARWCLLFMTKSPDISQIEVLLLLDCLLNKNIQLCKSVVDDIFRILKEPLESRTRIVNPGEILLRRLKCIRALIPLFNTSHTKIVKDILVELTQKNLNSTMESFKPQIILEQMEILTALSQRNVSWLSDNLGIVLGISLSVASYGLSHHSNSIPQYLLPTSLLFPDGKSASEFKTNQKNKNRRKPKKNAINKIKAAPLDDMVMVADASYWSQTSDSDFSDSESGRMAFQIKMERKIRLCAISLLLHIVNTITKKDLIGYWNNILDGPYSILKTLINDTAPRSRVSILAILSILFSTGKTYLSQAQHVPKGASLPSYVSWSHLLADLISSAHSALCQVVTQAQPATSSLATLQCLMIFMRNTPYHRLNDGLLGNIVRSVEPLLKHVDCALKLAALKCLNEVIVVEPNTEEQILLMRYKGLTESIKKNNLDSWIVTYCVNSIESEKVAIIIRAECWCLLGNVIKHHFINIGCGPHLPKILSLLRRDLQDSNVVIQQKAAKAFEQIAVPLGSSDTSCCVDSFKIWMLMLQGPLVPMLQSTSGILASAAADCIANITAGVFEQLPERLRIFVMTALCGCVSHEDQIARSAAIRTLGTIVVFPFLSESIQIIYDVADRIVCAMKDENLAVRTKGAWALGNLSDVLLNGRQIGIPIEEVSLLNLLEQAVQTGNDHEKVKVVDQPFREYVEVLGKMRRSWLDHCFPIKWCFFLKITQVKACSMRAIGNLFLLVEEHHIQIERFRTLVDEAVTALVHNAANENNMKVRWNACYSLGNIMKNDLLATHVPSGWQDTALQILSKLIVSCPNFKVRHAAANAMTNISCKEFYGKHYASLWPCLMKAFDNSRNLTEFSEYKHQRNLTDQLCLTLCHLTLFLDAEDADIICDLIPSCADLCRDYIVELKKRNENAREKFTQTVSYLSELLTKESNLKTTRRETILLLIDILQDSDSPSGEFQPLVPNYSDVTNK